MVAASELERKVARSKIPLRQLNAIYLGVSLGRRLQEDHPEIADYCRKLMTLTQISEALDISSKYEVTDEIARQAVAYALRGYECGINVDPYNGLIENEELELLRKKLFDRSIRESIKLKKGVIGLSPKDRSSYGRKGGKKSGKNNYERGIGFHKLSIEERVAIGREIATNKGYKVWSDFEINYAVNASQSTDYKRGKLVLCGLIAQELNQFFHDDEEVRTPKSVGRKLYRERKKRKKQNK